MTNLLTEPTDEVLERICDAFWNKDRAADYGVHFHSIHEHDAINHVLSGTIEVDGHVYGFIIENGNWNGTVVLEWDADPENVGIYTPPEPGEQLTFVPINPTTMAIFIYSHWVNEEWFKEMERNYLYDRHFQPGGFVEEHYREKAAKRGMEVGLFSDLGIKREDCPLPQSWFDERRKREIEITKAWVEKL